MNPFRLRWYRARFVIAMITAWLAIVFWIVSAVFGSGSAFADLTALILFCAAVTIVLTLVISRSVGRHLPTPPTRTVHSPVIGRWLAVNSPTSRVPSHGVRTHGQAYAIDLVAQPDGHDRSACDGRHPMPSAELYPAFGEPVYAMTDGVVVAASGWRRDHRARANLLGVLYLLVEGTVREMFGSGFLLGNHLIVRSDDGTFAVLAHLQRRSLTVGVGDQVKAGQQVARCGNSGNSSEPHLHAQLMDRRSPAIALGLPMTFADIEVDGKIVDQLPANNEHLIAAGADGWQKGSPGGRRVVSS